MEETSVAEVIKEVTVEIWETRMVRVKVSVEDETMEVGYASCAMARPRKPRKMARKLMNCILIMVCLFGSCDWGCLR